MQYILQQLLLSKVLLCTAVLNDPMMLLVQGRHRVHKGVYNFKFVCTAWHKLPLTDTQLRFNNYSSAQQRCVNYLSHCQVHYFYYKSKLYEISIYIY